MKTQFLNFVQNLANSVFSKTYTIIKISVNGIYRRVLVAKENLKEAIKMAYEVAKSKGLKIKIMGTYKPQKDYYITSFFNGLSFIKDHAQEPAPAQQIEVHEQEATELINDEAIPCFMSKTSLESLVISKPKSNSKNKNNGRKKG